MSRNKAEPDQKNQNQNNQLTRDFAFSGIRKLDGEGKERTFILSFSSEEPYGRYFGNEILDHSEGCADLKRINEIGCVLFNHDRDSVIAKINKAWIEDSKGYAEITFDSDEKSEIIYQKVVSTTLKGVSVGYLVFRWEEIEANTLSEDGRFAGKASIAKKWMPYEISIVSIPADSTVGVGRDMECGNHINDCRCSLSIYERQLQINKNKMAGGHRDGNERTKRSKSEKAGRDHQSGKG